MLPVILSASFVDTSSLYGQSILSRSDVLPCIDLRGDQAHTYNRTDIRVGHLCMNEKLEIGFDLDIRLEMWRYRAKYPLLFLQSNSMKMTLYLTSIMEFAIMHYNEQLDLGGHWKSLMEINLFDAEETRHALLAGFSHYYLQIHREGPVIANIARMPFFPRNTFRRIVPAGETITVWMDRQGFHTNATIKNLVIRSY